MQWFIVGSARDDHARALADLGRALGATAVADLPALVADRRFGAAPRHLVIVPDDAVATGDVATFAREHAERTFVVCLGAAIAPGDYKRLLQTEAAEWVAWGGHEAELREIAARHDGPEAAARAAKVVAFVPSKGGSGNTLLTVETAMHLATARRRRRGSRLALLDLNLQGGTAADALDLQPRFDVAEIVDRPERLDEQLVDVFTSRHDKGFDVFASPINRIDPSAVRPDTIFAFIDTVAARYDALLLDLPAVWMPWTDPLLAGSDAVVASGGKAVPALRKLAALLAHLDALAIPEGRTAAVVNPMDGDVFGRMVRAPAIDRALGTRRAFLIRRDAATVADALDSGESVLEGAPTSRVGRDLRGLAEWVETAIGWAAAPKGSAAPRVGAVLRRASA